MSFKQLEKAEWVVMYLTSTTVLRIYSTYCSFVCHTQRVPSLIPSLSRSSAFLRRFVVDPLPYMSIFPLFFPCQTTGEMLPDMNGMEMRDKEKDISTTPNTTSAILNPGSITVHLVIWEPLVGSNNDV